jgi:hypothetical protein
MTYDWLKDIVKAMGEPKSPPAPEPPRVVIYVDFKGRKRVRLD